jgi:hypothetical protein
MFRLASCGTKLGQPTNQLPYETYHTKQNVCLSTIKVYFSITHCNNVVYNLYQMPVCYIFISLIKRVKETYLLLFFCKRTNVIFTQENVLELSDSRQTQIAK